MKSMTCEIGEKSNKINNLRNTAQDGNSNKINNLRVLLQAPVESLERRLAVGYQGSPPGQGTANREPGSGTRSCTWNCGL